MPWDQVSSTGTRRHWRIRRRPAAVRDHIARVRDHALVLPCAAMIQALIRLARPRDWAKSVFVLLPVPFAWRAGATFSVRDLAIGVLAFCATASAVASNLVPYGTTTKTTKQRASPNCCDALCFAACPIWDTLKD